MNWVDYLLISIIILSGIVGYYKGFLGVLRSLITFAILFVASSLLSIQVSEFAFSKTTISNSISLFLERAFLDLGLTSNSLNNISLLHSDIMNSSYVKFLNQYSSLNMASFSFSDIIGYIVIHAGITLILILALSVLYSSILTFITERFSLGSDDKTPKFRLVGLLTNMAASSAVLFFFMKAHVTSLVVHVHNTYTYDVIHSQIGSILKQYFS